MKNNRNWYFFILKLFPLVIAFACAWGNGLQDVTTNINSILLYFNIGAISTILNTILNSMQWVMPTGIVAYVTYLIAITIVQIMYDLIMFLPNFCRGVFDKWEKV